METNLKRFNRVLDGLVRAFLGFCLAALVVISFGQVVGRYFFGTSFSWAEDLCVIIFAWTIWTSACLLIRDDRHLKLTLVINRLNRTGRLWLARAIDLITAVFLILVVKAGLGSTEAMAGMEFTALPLPLNVKFGTVPIGAGLLCYYVLRRLVDKNREV
jgi:TRAP-type C4-dicarboxylate transport system permease small subunit